LGPARPDVPPPIRFLFVEPVLRLQLPSDPQSLAAPLPSANSSPCRVSRGLAPPECVRLPGAPPPRHCRVLPSSTRRAKNSEAFPSAPRRGGAQRRGGEIQDRLSATLSRPALLHEEGEKQ